MYFTTTECYCLSNNGVGNTGLFEHLLKKRIGEGADYDLHRQLVCDYSYGSK